MFSILFNAEKKLLLAACALCLLTGTVSATNDQLEVIEIIDTHELPFHTGDVVSEESTGFSSSIDYRSLNKAGFSLGAVLDHEAATQIRSSGGFGSYSDISLRGTTSEQVMIYLDGMLLNHGSGGGVDLSEIDTSQIVRIDIYRGSTPLQLSKASFGGAVNIITHRGSDKILSEVQTSTGSFNTKQLSAQISTQQEKLSGLISLSSASSDNDFEFINDNQTEFNTEDDETQKRNNAEVKQQSALIKAGWAFSHSLKLDGSVRLFTKDQAIPGWNNQESTDTSLDTRSWQARTRLTNDGGINLSYNTFSELYFIKKNETYDDSNSQIGLGSQHDKNTSYVNGIKAYVEHIGKHSTSALSLDYHMDKYKKQDLLQNQKDNQSERAAFDLGFQHNHFLDDEKWLLSPSIRSQWFNNKYQVEEDLIQQKNTKNYSTGQLGVKYTWSENLILKTNAGTYIREPSFFELFGDRGLLLGNDELNPEKGTNLDIGLEWSNTPYPQKRTHIRIQLGAWYNDVKDLIARTYDARGIGKSQNISSARLRGVEAGLLLHLNNGLQVNTNITLQNPENRSKNAAFIGKILPGRATQNIFISLQYSIRKWLISYEYDRQVERFYDTANLLRAKDSTLHNVSIGRKVGNHLALNFGINNLLDENYEDFNGFPKPGRACTLSLKYKYTH